MFTYFYQQLFGLFTMVPRSTAVTLLGTLRGENGRHHVTTAAPATCVVWGILQFCVPRYDARGEESHGTRARHDPRRTGRALTLTLLLVKHHGWRIFRGPSPKVLTPQLDRDVDHVCCRFSPRVRCERLCRGSACLVRIQPGKTCATVSRSFRSYGSHPAT